MKNLTNTFVLLVELMLMGFISLLLTVFQGPISGICIPTSVANTWHPCDKKAEAKKYSESSGRKLLEFSDDSTYIPRRSLASKYDKCQEQARLPLLFYAYLRVYFGN